jgi:hypothetical protein
MNEELKYKIASLIIFKDDVEMEQVMKWINVLKERGVIEGHDTREYISKYGDPRWYIP